VRTCNLCSTPAVPNLWSTASVPLHYPESTRPRPVRTSVGAHPHVAEVFSCNVAEDALAADDVDGARSVDHSRVPITRSPRRAGRNTRPRHTCMKHSWGPSASMHPGTHTRARSHAHATHTHTHARVRTHTHTHAPTRTLSTEISGPRTSVGARPHVVVVGVAGAPTAEDIDGAGGVDHGRVVISPSPRRAGRTARPRDACGRRARNQPMAKRTRGCPLVAAEL
jgi:hypothetical protein